MNKEEKIRRCTDVETYKGGNCVVYGRTVSGCADCAFSWRTRELIKAGVWHASAERTVSA